MSESLTGETERAKLALFGSSRWRRSRAPVAARAVCLTTRSRCSISPLLLSPSVYSVSASYDCLGVYSLVNQAPWGLWPAVSAWTVQIRGRTLRSGSIR